MSAAPPVDHTPRFDRFGRAPHLRIEGAADLAAALDLDEALWVATSAPVDTIHTDAAFLEYLDTDGDGRIRVYELKQAIRWTLAVLGQTRGLEQASDELRIDALNADHPDGGRIAASMQKMARRLELGAVSSLTLGQIRQIKHIEQTRAVSEAGVVLPEAALSESAAAFIEDVIRTTGGAAHPTGRSGLDAAKLEQFLHQARGLLAWREQAALADEQQTTDIMPLGSRTPRAFAAFAAVRAKLDQFFAQGRALELDPSLAGRFTLQPADVAGHDLDDPASIAGLMRKAPIAPPTPQRQLDLAGPINPAYHGAIDQLRTEVLEPLLGRPVGQLTEADWQAVTDALAVHAAWRAAKVGQAVEPLGEARLRQYLEPRYADAVRDLIVRSRSAALMMDNIRLAEKLACFQRYLVRFANNYISFPELYHREKVALFDMGNTVIDGRRLNLAVRVHNRAEHAAIAQTSNMYTMYLQITGANIEAYEVAVAVTSGGQGNLAVGKRGIFEDHLGCQLDARVVQIIDNPISLREAMIQPFKRLGKVISGKIESIASTAESKLDQTGTAAVTTVHTQVTAETPPGTAAPATPPPPAAAARPGAGAGSLLAGGGIAIAALGSSLAFITKTLAGLAWYTIVAGIGAALAAVIVPTLIVAVIKLRRRDLSALLEGAGWAINARMRLTRRQSRYFTARPRPPGTLMGLTWRGGLILLAWLAAIAIATFAGLTWFGR